MSEYLSWEALPARRPLGAAAGRALAALLRAASSALDGQARRLEARRVPLQARQRGVVEFHAESGAPEGALYVDGRLVGWIEGVNRL